MTEDEYWAIVHAARVRSGKPAAVAQRVQTALRQLPAETIVEFLDVQERLMARSYTSALWGAAYVMNGGCSDDGFDYFRGWLFTQGRDVFERALVDPDSLADIDVRIDDAECEAMIEVGMDAYLEITGDYPTMPFHPRPALDPSPDFDDRSEMRRAYPRLAEKYW